MEDTEYKFIIDPERREQAFLHVFCRIYPVAVFKYLFCQKPSLDTLFNILFSPLIVLRNICSGISSQFMFRTDVIYRLILHDGYITFGVGVDTDKLMANSYDNITHIFKSMGRWTVLLRDGWIIYLPPDQRGEKAVKRVRVHHQEQTKRRHEREEIEKRMRSLNGMVFLSPNDGETYGGIHELQMKGLDVCPSDKEWSPLAQDNCGDFFLISKEDSIGFWNHEADEIITLAESIDEFAKHCSKPEDVNN